MLSKDDILGLLNQINQRLTTRGEHAEIGLVGGAVMCLVYNTRNATKDVNAIFEPAAIVREIAAEIAADEGLAANWLNYAAKGFLQPGFARQEVLHLSNLLVWAPEPRYMLAMKCMSARWDTSDKDDVIFLMKFLKIESAKDVLDLIEGYYPKNKIPPKTQFFVEELFE